jgi:RimJ/RimL family protein N-acetyltransferase
MSILEAAERLPDLAGERVVLRWLTERDVPALHGVFSDPEVTRFWSWPAFEDRAQAAALLQEIHDCFRERSLFQWGIARRTDDLVIGTCTLARLDERHRRAELGFALARGHWGHGFAAEALPLVVGFAFETLELHRLEADADPRNERSLRALERLGFRREGHLRERYHQCGELQDALLYGLLRSEWPAAASAQPRPG